MLSPRANIHRSHLPAPGEIGYIRGLSTIDPRRRCIVSHYPLYDSLIIATALVFTRFMCVFWTTRKSDALVVSGLTRFSERVFYLEGNYDSDSQAFIG